MNLVERAKNILISPNKEWEVIKNETSSVGQIFTGYAVILALIPTIAAFIGQSLIGINLGFLGSYKVPISNALTYAVLSYALSLVGVYVIAFIIDTLAPSFGSTKDMVSSLKVSVYSSTAAWIAGIFSIFPALSILSILGLYSLYLMYLGLKIVKAPPADKLIGYFIVVIIISIVVYIVIGMVVSAVALPSTGLDALKNMKLGN